MARALRCRLEEFTEDDVLGGQCFWLIFLFLGFTSRNCRAGRAPALWGPANESKESFLAVLGVAS